VLAVVMACAMPGTAAAADAPAAFARADAHVQESLRRTGTPGAAYAVISGGRVVHRRTWGRDGTGAPITTRTPFLIGSLSKSFTALAVMQLVEAGRIGLDQPIRAHLPWLRLRGPGAERVTVRHLLTHTSGLSTRDGYIRSDRFDNAPGGVRRRARELARVRLESPPGTRHAYSDANYMLLGALVEQVTGRPFGERLRASILEPLGMRDAIADAERAERIPPGHRSYFGEWRAFDPPYDASGLPYGYLAASLDDLAAYAIAQLGGGRNVLSEAGVRQLHTGTADVHGSHRYGFGWRDDVVDGLGVRMVWHSGSAAAGYHAIMILVPDRDLAVVVLQNAFSIAEDALFNAAGFGAVRILLGDSPRPVEADPLIGRLLVALAVLAALLTAALIRSLVRVFRPARPGRSRIRAVGGGAASVAVCLLLAHTAHAVVPRWFDGDLRMVLLFVPDGGHLLVAIIVLSLALAAAQAAGTVRAAIGAGRRPRSAEGGPPGRGGGREADGAASPRAGRGTAGPGRPRPDLPPRAERRPFRAGSR